MASFITAQQREALIELYIGYFNRAPEAAGLNYWAGELLAALNAGQTEQQALAGIANRFYDAGVQFGVFSNAMTVEQFIRTVYQNVLGRDEVDAAGMTYWTQKLTSGEVSRGQFVRQVIQEAKDYVAAAPANDPYKWVGTYLENRKAVGEWFANNSTGLTGQAAIDQGTAIIANSVTKATAQAGQTASQAVAAAQAAQTAQQGQTFTLTTGVDNIAGTGSNDTINAVQTSTSGSVFGGLDVVDGAGGNDTLNVQDTATAASAAFSFNGATIKNVETLALTTSGYLKNLDLSGFTGLKTVSLLANSTNASADNTGLKLGSIDTVAVTAQAGNVSIASGGKAINITAAGAATIGVGATGVGNQNTSATSLTLKTGSGTVNAYGSALTDVTVLGGGTVTIQNSDSSGGNNNGTTLKSVTLKNDAGATVDGKAIETLTLSGQGAGGTARTITVNNSTSNHALTVNVDGTGYKTDGTETQTIVVDAAAKTITVNATGSKSSLALTGSNVVTTLNITGSAALKQKVDDRGTLTTIDGSAATGNLTLGDLNAATVNVKTGSGNDSFAIQATSKVSVDAGAGNDTVTLKSAVAAGSTINLGAGNDKLLLATGGSVAVSSSTLIDGGDGTDSVSANLLNAGNAAQFKNFELVNLDSTTGFDLALLGTNNTITGLTMSSASTTATYQNVTKSMGLTIDFVGNNSSVTNTLSMTGVSGTDDSYTITFAGNNSGTAPTSANVRAGTVVTSCIENYNIVSGGTNAWNEITLGTNSAAKTVTITGASNLNLAFASGFGSIISSNTGVSLIDGSAATGKLSIDTTNVTAATAGLTVKGGSAADTITLAQKATVDAGAGDDTITAAAAGGTITTGAGADTVNVKVAVAASTSAPVITTITDFTVGTDKITFKDQGTETFTATKVDVSTATALFDGTANALDLAATANAGTNAAITWFQYAGDTYIVQDLSAANTFAATDIVVKLSGLVDLSGLSVHDFNFA
ncbi:S-layer protein [Tepidimonas thermarum]|uniref:S-layer protein n=1 Tax=Tepidimonas thermarum TaxID=335431 RepID=A0A554X4L7_9BURK|nr:DUF4214 domain-containing protein [Tepidimonas thermarum]TSE30779.1 S-layer protein [Tepidimonas thermarum]